MRVSYKGMDRNYPYRVAEMSYDEEREQNAIDKVVERMENYGWKVDTAVAGLYLCEVEDYDEYKDFVRDWKKAKKEVCL